MKKSLIALAVHAMLGAADSFVRAQTNDISFTYRMGAGFVGDVNRTHPASILPSLQDTTTPVRLYGDPVLLDAVNNTSRGVLVADQATVTSIGGVLVRPYPTQQTTGGMSSSIGAATPPVGPAVVDVLEDGFILVKCNNFAVNAPTRGGAAFVWAAASAGAHVLGGFEAAASAGSTIALTNAEFMGPADADGTCELRVWKAKRT